MISNQKCSISKFIISCFTFICVFAFSSEIYSQPSGGPYGPIPQKYELPKVTGKIYFAAPDGKENQSQIPRQLNRQQQKLKQAMR